MSVFTNIASSIGAAAGSVSGDLQGVGEAFTAASHKQGAEKWVVEHDQLRQRFSIKLTASGVATPAAHAATTASTDGRLAAGLRSLSLTAAAAPEASLTYKLLGSATCQQAQQGCTQAELVDIFVPEAFRERGCASALVAAMLAYAAERSICDVLLVVSRRGSRGENEFVCDALVCRRRCRRVRKAARGHRARRLPRLVRPQRGRRDR